MAEFPEENNSQCKSSGESSKDYKMELEESAILPHEDSLVNHQEHLELHEQNQKRRSRLNTPNLLRKFGFSVIEEVSMEHEQTVNSIENNSYVLHTQE
mmetsp:Transcript_34721/g.25868  ORF Transcript_34721/g.25868 Transcript_34721/m.25868 type:complete len:98 (-) Transcript_34721:25-318(-)